MLGFYLSEATVSRWMRRAPRSPHLAQHSLRFLRNHREAIAAMDFFAVPTLTFGVLYGFFVIAHDRRRILHCTVTRSPEAAWVALQLRQTWDEGEEPQRFLLFDRDAKFGVDVASTVKAMGSQPVRTGFRSPWQNGVGPGIRNLAVFDRWPLCHIVAVVYASVTRRRDEDQRASPLELGNASRAYPIRPRAAILPECEDALQGICGAAREYSPDTPCC